MIKQSGTRLPSGNKKRGEREKSQRVKRGEQCLLADVFSLFSFTTEPGPRLVIKIQMSVYRSYLMLFNSQKVYDFLHLTNNQQNFYLVFPQGQGRAANERRGLEISPGYYKDDPVLLSQETNENSCNPKNCLAVQFPNY